VSRIGNKIVVLPAGVEVKQAGNDITVKGPKGELTKAMAKDINIAIEDNQVVVTRPSDAKEHRALHGLTRALINNMVIGVTNGFSKTLQLIGVGYRATAKGKGLTLNLGFSHPVEIDTVDGITFELTDATTIVIKGIDKELVGDVAADIRVWRKPEPYKGKGIKYSDEVIRRKEGKTGK